MALSLSDAQRGVPLVNLSFRTRKTNSPRRMIRTSFISGKIGEFITQRYERKAYDNKKEIKKYILEHILFL
jgi:hypothetical protein